MADKKEKDLPLKSDGTVDKRRLNPGRPDNLTRKGMGRPKGSKNKFTNLKGSFVDVFVQHGGTNALLKWLRKNPKNEAEFYKLLSKMLPKEVELSGKEDGEPITFEVVKYAVEEEKNDSNDE